MPTFTLVKDRKTMYNIDEEEFTMLKGTETMENLIKNRVPVTGDLIKNHSTQLCDIVAAFCTNLYYVRRVHDYQTIFYFSSPIDRSRFLDACNRPESLIAS